ncbi:AAA family ATPase [Novosphingobium sp. 2638]|uniref:AAA family ATPase n=2 Tax=Novosphingobium beihaiensis TaxID=2930389 RepID=A0ABT0BU03_9SPHN|nr:AAA family ATPase [Novosphingobium beihaiensis]
MLAERDNELARLAALLAAAGKGGHVVAIGGEAGIGKTALLREFASGLADDCECIWGMCDPLLTPRPLGPVLDITAMLGGLGDDWDTAGGTALFSRLLAHLAERPHPAVLILEDVHWADAGTLDFIRFLSRRITICPVLLIISYRNDELGRNHPLLQVFGDIPGNQMDRIELHPLSLAAVARLAGESGRDAESLLAITGGNPFFLSEILASPEAGKAVPVSVQDAVNSRLARLPQAHITFIEALSVIPVPIDPALHCRWIEDHERLLQDCCDLAILIEDSDGRLRFRHELARLATSNRCSSIDKRNLHQQHLVMMLESPERYDTGELLHHACGAGDAARVLQFGPVAAEKAARLGAHKEAADYLEAALAYIDEAEPEEAAQLYESWAYEAAISHRIDDRVIEARRHALTMWRALGRKEKIADNLRHLSRLHWYRGEAVQANRYLDEAINLLEQIEDTGLLALAYSMRSQMHMLSSRMEEAIEWGERAVACIAGQAKAGVEVHALNNIGTARMFLGDPAGIAELERSLGMALENNLHEDAARVFTNLSEYAVDMRRLALAETILDRGIAFDTKHDLDSWTFYLLGRQAQLRLEQGRLQEAEDICRSVIGTPGQTLLMKLPARIMLARAQVRMGEDDAARLLAKAHKDALATGEVQYCIPVLIGMAERAWLTGSEALAADALGGLDRIDACCFSLWTAAEYAFWQRLLGREAVPVRTASDTAFGPALGGDFSASGMAFARLGADYFANLCFGLADSPQTVSSGFAALHRQGAKAVVARLTELLESRGLKRDDVILPRGPYKAARENPFGLTAKEMTVLEYLAEGLSNAEIADEMSRSQRTVEHHVSAILQKLEAENRLAVLLKLREQPWIIGEPAAETGR